MLLLARVARTVGVSLTLLVLPAILWAQGRSVSPQPITSKEVKQAPRVLEVVQTTRAASEVARTFSPPLRCDRDGNIYLLSEPFGVSGIRKLSPKGERLALFLSRSNPELKLDAASYFAVRQDGEVYQLAFPREISRFVIVYKPDGSYESKIKLQTGFPWMPAALGVFPSGSLLVTGQEYDRDKNAARWPFTGLFSAEGVLQKEIKLADDDAIHEMGVSGDSRVTSPEAPLSNLAVGFSQVEAADDGNLYLMRWLSPAIVYAISPTGEVMKRFAVDAGDEDYRPEAMHVSGNHIAVLFFQPQTGANILKVVDLQGRAAATYQTQNSAKEETTASPGPLFGAFACFSDSPERYTFVVTGENERLALTTVEPQ